MNISQIHTLLTCRQPEFQQAAICQLLSQEPTPWPDILALLPAIPEAVAEKLLTAVRRKHPFLRMGYGDPELVDGRRFENFQPLANELSRLVDCVREALSRPDCKRRQLLTTLTALPGIRHETRRCLQENQNDGELTWFDQACVPLPLQKPPRQFMLFVTYACNLRCPYCFAAGLQPDDMSWERAVGMLDWAVANQVETMTFCGGEPTRWAHFPAMLDEVKARGLNCYFATNLLPRPGVMERLTPDYVLSLIVHGALRSVYSDSQWNSFQR
ncbi:MAG TPA: radical SAM protein, partial [Lentisphaeria bacterium]|nr:radical SAM protein [Lentisphaeria bacterium]